MKHEIKLSKGKQLLGSAIAVILIILGISLLVDPEIFGPLPFSSAKIFAIGITIILIFVGTLMFLVFKMISRSNGLVISEEGIEDLSTAFASGLIKWEEMKGFGVKRQVGVHFVVIYLKDAEGFLNRFNKVKKAVMKKNSESYGTPVAISLALLDIKIDELRRLLEAEGAKHSIHFEG